MKARVTMRLGMATLVVALGLLIVVVGGAGSDAFGTSRVTPTAEQVHPGDILGFSLYAVNTGGTTATEVLIWNPIPDGARYVSASGGAFPVIGGSLAGGAPPPNVPDGFAYDAATGAVVSLPEPDAGEITGIAWTGSIPGNGGMKVVGLIVEVVGRAGETVVDTMQIYHDRALAFETQAEVQVQPYRLYLPFCYQKGKGAVPPPTQVMTFTIPHGVGLALGGGCLDPDYWQALACPDPNIGGDESGTLLGQSPPSGPYIPWYMVARAYVGWDTSILPDDAQVLSATLLLGAGCNQPDVPFRVTVYRGVWTPPLNQDAWYAMGTQPVGAWNVDHPCDPPCQPWRMCAFRVGIDPGAVNRTGLTLLEMRSDNEGTPPTGHECTSLSRSIIPQYPLLPLLIVSYVEEP